MNKRGFVSGPSHYNIIGIDTIYKVSIVIKYLKVIAKPKMPSKNSAVFLAILTLSLTLCAAAQDCQTGLKDESKGMDAVMATCSNVGVFSLGGKYNGQWEILTYYYPAPWEGTYFTINVDGKYYVNSVDPRDGIRMDQYLTVPPTVDGSRLYAGWTLPEGVSVVESVELVDNSSLIHITIKNQNADKSVSAGARIHLDTMLGDNDGAPIYIPGDGLIETEKEYSGGSLDFKYWKAYNRADSPNIVSTGILQDVKLTYPDKLLISDWKQSTRTAWDYTANGSKSILGDSAVILYYYPMNLGPGEMREIVTGYGSGEPVLRNISQITEITLNNLTGRYCMGDIVGMKVDVGTRIDLEGFLKVSINNSLGEMVYSERTATGIIKAESVKSIEYRYRIPLNASQDQFTITAELQDAQGNVLDTRNSGFSVDPVKCGKTETHVTESPQGPNWFLIVLAVIIIIGALIFIASRKKGELLFKKMKTGDRVVVSIVNNTEHDITGGVIEDRFAEGAELDIQTLNVRRRGTNLTLHVGILKSGDKASLEYRIKGVETVPKAKFRWDCGEMASQ